MQHGTIPHVSPSRELLQLVGNKTPAPSCPTSGSRNHPLVGEEPAGARWLFKKEGGTWLGRTIAQTVEIKIISLDESARVVLGARVTLRGEVAPNLGQDEAPADGGGKENNRGKGNVSLTWLCAGRSMEGGRGRFGDEEEEFGPSAAVGCRTWCAAGGWLLSPSPWLTLQELGPEGARCCLYHAPGQFNIPSKMLPGQMPRWGQSLCSTGG